jgi:hypothetical protein
VCIHIWYFLFFSAILVKLHQDNPTASSEDTHRTKKLVEEISEIEKDILQYIQSPASDGTGLPGPSMAVVCCGGEKPCACSSSQYSQSDHQTVKNSGGTDSQNIGESVVPSSDKNLNHGSSDSSVVPNPIESANVSRVFSNKINQVKQEVVSLLKKMAFSDDFIATL